MSERGIEAVRANEIARASGGRPGWAILAAEDGALAEARDAQAEQLLSLIGSSRLERISAADALAERWSGHPDDVRNALQTWSEIWHDVLLAQSGLADRIGSITLGTEILAAAHGLSEAEVQRGLASTLELGDALERNAHPRLALEAYTLFLPRLSRSFP